MLPVLPVCITGRMGGDRLEVERALADVGWAEGVGSHARYFLFTQTEPSGPSSGAQGRQAPRGI